MIDPQIISKIRKVALKFDLQFIYLFGSKATGKDTKLSDIDIAVFLKNPKTTNLKNLTLNLIFDFSKAFHTDTIDLIILNTLQINK